MRGFDIIEYKKRVSKAVNLMREKDLEIVVITSPHNFRYFSGLDSYFWESPTRPWFLVLSQNNDPCAVIPSIGKTALENTWLDNIKTWQSPNPTDEGISCLQETIFSINSKGCKIGFELGLESYLRMSIKDFEKLKKIMPNYKFLDAGSLIWKLRMIKSDNEIEKIKKIISIASRAFDELPNKMKIGQSEIQISNIMKKSMIEMGADHTLYMSCASGKGGYDQIICDATEKKLVDGDILTIDTGTTLDGYFCDFNRNFGFGKIENSAKTAYDILWKATEKAMEVAKPGNTCADISNAISNILFNNLNHSNIGRMGHGLGLQVTEPPSIMPSDKTLLKENMIITIEPSLEYAPGVMLVQEENILITNNGCEILTSRTPLEMPIIV